MRVFYFPQGHSEQSSSPPCFSSRVLSSPSVHCVVTSVHFLANPETDEIFAKIRLQPIGFRSSACFSPNNDGEGSSDDSDNVVSFAKILTPSDANNGGGFSVPRFCADSIFPPLDYQAEPPVQTISIRDIHGTFWEFRHIYRGTPRRHLLTTGWSKFVNSKKLIAGDSVVFMKNKKSEIFVGIRRASRSNSSDCVKWNCRVGWANVSVNKVDDEGSKKGKVSAEAVAEAAELAAQGMAFEIVYYPKAGSADFVVKAETVEESMKVMWSAGTRIKMAVETEDSSRLTWSLGTVSTACVPENGPWRGSPWRMLQMIIVVRLVELRSVLNEFFAITWDEPEILQNMKRVSPWQVEYVVPTAPHDAFPPAKKFRASPNLGALTDGDGDGDLFYPMAGLPNSMMGQLTPPLLNYHTFPAGMQGARQDPFCVSKISNFLGESALQACTDSATIASNMASKLQTVSTELNIGSSQAENLSPDSQTSVHFYGLELGNQGCNSAERVRISSFQLFGKVIQTKQPVDGYQIVGTEDDRNKEYNGTEAENNSLDLSLSCPCKELLERLDVKCQRVPGGEAYTLLIEPETLEGQHSGRFSLGSNWTMPIFKQLSIDLVPSSDGLRLRLSDFL
ncbi:B3 DNA binding domain [Dillenia turbinata]|uniref:Auxin response factor n=1 Tax=Dillenia turbinata TaxID=194707 RepID=A0AAN8ZMV9_9MAGN